MIRVSIAEDHNLVRHGIVRLLNSYKNIKVLNEVTNGKELLVSINNDKPELVIIDLKMPIIDGIELTKILQKRYPIIRIIVLSMYYEDNFINYMFQHGVSAYISKNCEPEELITAVNEVAKNGYYHSKAVLRALSTNYRNKKCKAHLKKSLYLTEREREVLCLICEGLTSEAIGKQLILSKRTIETHRADILRKLEVKNTIMLVRFVIKNNLLSNDLKPEFNYDF